MKKLNETERLVVFHLLCAMKADAGPQTISDLRESIDANRRRIRAALESLPLKLQENDFPLFLNKNKEGKTYLWEFRLERERTETVSRPSSPRSMKGTPGGKLLTNLITDAVSAGRMQLGSTYTPTEIRELTGFNAHFSMQSLLFRMGNDRHPFKFRAIGKGRYELTERRTLTTA